MKQWGEFLEWLRINQIGDLTGLFGIIISIVGFALTLIGVVRSAKSADRAELAAKTARDSIRLFDTVVDFTLAISILEEIKRNHRNEQWHFLLDRYTNIRKILVTLRTENQNLSEEQQKIIQTTLTNLSNIEQHVEKNLENPSALKASKLNYTISGDIDNLLTVLIELKLSNKGNTI